MKTRLRSALLLLSLLWVSIPSASAQAPTFAKGADVSWLTQMEAAGYKFYTKDGVPQDAMQILKGYGLDAIRLRVWVNPADGWNGQADVVAKAVRARNLGYRLMIDFHYSDSWADPGKQTKPAAWQSYNFTQLKQAVYDHTFAVLTALKAQGITPEWVQVGNETNNGMLWEDGKASVNMKNFADLVSSGYDAVKAVSSQSKVIVHLSNGYDNGLFRWMFDGLTANNARYDVIGMSLYPTTANWPTLTAQCLTNINDMVARYGKEVMICEIGMPYTAPQATQEMIADLLKKVRSVPNNKGLGVFYWEPQAYNWQGYTLGAWSLNGRPTTALEAFLEQPTAPPSPLQARNPGFEYDGAATQTPTGWSTRSTADQDADKTEFNGHTGDYRLTHYKATAYQVATYQVLTNLPNGRYTLKAWVQNGGGQTLCQLYARDFGSTDKTAALPVTATWAQVQLTNINVTNGQCEIGLLSQGNAGNYCSIDDVELVAESVTAASSAASLTATTVFPNPFSEDLAISYTLSKSETVRIDLYTTTGQLVQTMLAPQQQAAGAHTWQNKSMLNNLGSGLYLLRLTHDGQTLVQRVVRR
ncbi:glycosyl hydrolase 53 family protein [Hymenobacter cavernae]|uniref:Arabinogalactan endo-beta-1,4-galactanase n=1 Tax=Hymenobacter cavernae TaxID=2044852 RepID=A0ABQ1UCZ3_9BACT|nr:glycosyl hydrolase 53 family protein [Hymenobacter cavernae]GGF13279.1 hypothetical protein GCM10011383_25610 [Hymenobacter cavernae]